MGDGVKFIFKTLFKVPVLVFVSFFIMNILFFFLTYFKMLGFSYVIMQTAVENNYLPAKELASLASYASNLNNGLQTGTAVITYYSGSTDASDSRYGIDKAGNKGYMDANGNVISSVSMFGGTDEASHKKQYGRTSRVGCSCNYVLIWPLDYKDTLKAGEVQGLDGAGGPSGFKDNSTLESMRNDSQHHVSLKIRIVYEVPGLKYYPDLTNY